METKITNVFHEGEKFLQERAGTGEFAQKLGEMKILNYVQDEFKEFIENRHTIWISSMDPKTGDVWSSAIFATPIFEEAEREARHIQNIEEERNSKMHELKDKISKKEKLLNDNDRETIGGEVRSKIDELKLIEETLELEEEGVICDHEESAPLLPENEVGNISFCKPYDSCSVGGYVSSITPKFQSSCYRPLVHVENPSTIHILNSPSKDDPAINNIYPGSMISLNFIEFDTRKRFRVNGVVKSPLLSSGFSVHVIESFTTCPKYIQRRAVVGIRENIDNYMETSDTHGTLLPNHLVKLIINADTFMIATIDEKRGADSSHRGGRIGFVRVIDDKILVWGDYIGKGMFQTLGNTVTNPRTGLLFMDWKRGDLLQLSGTIKIDWETKLASTGPGTGLDDAERTVIFTVNKWIYRKGRIPYMWKYLQPSSHSPILRDNFDILKRYGTKIVSLLQYWRKKRKKDLFIPTTLIEIRNETPEIKTFKFQTEHYIAYQPGQYTTWTIEIDGMNFMRSWTISSANLVYFNFSEDSLDHLVNSSKLLTDNFEITVKRKKDGVVSNYLMDLDPKDKNSVKLTLMGIEGTFTLYSSARYIRMMNKRRDKIDWKLAMISGGIGITPIISILRGINNTYEEEIFSEKDLPNIIAIHTDRNIRSIPFKDDLQKFKHVPICKLAIAITEEKKNEIDNGDKEILEKLVDTSSKYIRYGRINQDYINTVCPDIAERMVYLCGPEGFMSAMVSILKKMGVPEAHIVTESFTY